MQAPEPHAGLQVLEEIAALMAGAACRFAIGNAALDLAASRLCETMASGLPMYMIGCPLFFAFFPCRCACCHNFLLHMKRCCVGGALEN